MPRFHTLPKRRTFKSAEAEIEFKQYITQYELYQISEDRLLRHYRRLSTGGGRGFASMSPEARKAIASKGGKAVAPEDRSFSRYPMMAQQAGQKGGRNIPPENRSFSRDPDLARAAGAKGGRNRKPKPTSEPLKAVRSAMEGLHKVGAITDEQLKKFPK